MMSRQKRSIIYHTIAQVFLAYDLLEDRRAINVIIRKFFLLCFKMAESFDSILRDLVKIRHKKSCRGIEQVREVGKTKKKLFSFRE